MESQPTVEAVTLRSSRGAMAMTVLGLGGLIVFAVAVLVLNGLNFVTGSIALFALVSTAVILFDLPLRTTFDASGIRRRTPFRDHRIEWDEVERLVRMRRGGIRRPGSEKWRGIVVIRGGRRTVLVDRTEDDAEHARLRSVLIVCLADERFNRIRKSERR